MLKKPHIFNRPLSGMDLCLTEENLIRQFCDDNILYDRLPTQDYHFPDPMVYRSVA